MYKINIDCDKDCSIELESASEIIPIKNRNAKISYPRNIAKKINPQTQEIINIFEEIHIINPTKKLNSNSKKTQEAVNQLARQKAKLAKELEDDRIAMELEESRKRIEKEREAKIARELQDAKMAQEIEKKLLLELQESKRKKEMQKNVNFSKGLEYNFEKYLKIAEEERKQLEANAKIAKELEKAEKLKEDKIRKQIEEDEKLAKQLEIKKKLIEDAKKLDENAKKKQEIEKKLLLELEETKRKKEMQKNVNFSRGLEGNFEKYLKIAEQGRKENTEPKKPKLIIKSKINSCENIKGYNFNKNSCYADSTLFSLFAFPSDFVQHYILNAKEEEIKQRMDKSNHIKLGYTEEQKQTILDYVLFIQSIVKDTVNMLHQGGNGSNNLSNELRNNLLGNPTDIITNPLNKPWQIKEKGRTDEQDTHEFLLSLFGTFFIENIKSEITRNYYKNEKLAISLDKEKSNSSPTILLSISEINNFNELNFTNKEELEFGNEFIPELRSLIDSSVELQTIEKQKTLLLINKLLNIIYKDYSKNKLLNSNLTTLVVKAKYKSIINVMDGINTKKLEQDDMKFNEAVKKVPINLEKEFYREIKDIFGKNLDYSENQKIANQIDKYIKEVSSPYHIKHLQFLSKISIYGNKLSINYNYKVPDNAYDQYIIISISRFNPFDQVKNTKLFEISDSLLKQNGDRLQLNSIVIHEGSSIEQGHYTVAFRCNDMWYEYNNIGNKIKKIGTFAELLQYQNQSIPKNCVQLYYNNIIPRV